MTLFQDAGGTPRAAAAQLADVLSWYGAIGDAVFGNLPGFALQKASLAVALASIDSVSAEVRNATFLAGLLHTVGAIGNAAYRKGVELPERAARTQRWDVPAQGGRLCAGIAALPKLTAELVRWQSECWDGTGHPDQLRWHGIPPGAQHLALADAYLRISDPEVALNTIALQSGRAFGPDATRTFVVWFHSTGGEIPSEGLPLDALDTAQTGASTLLDTIADRVDEHNGSPGRWRSIEAVALETAAALGLDARTKQALALATRLCGAGELQSNTREDAELDPRSRFGIEERANNAQASAAFVAPLTSLCEASEILAARGEWYDGSGKPRGLRHQEIPIGARILAAAVAYVRLDRSERLDTAVGTQFDPGVVRAMLELAQTQA